MQKPCEFFFKLKQNLITFLFTSNMFVGESSTDRSVCGLPLTVRINAACCGLHFISAAETRLMYLFTLLSLEETETKLA